MKLLTGYILAYAALIYVFFTPHGTSAVYEPLKTGLLYSVGVSSRAAINDEVAEKILFKRSGEDDYPTIDVSSAEKLPGKFLARLVDAKEARYMVVAASGEDKRRVEAPKERRSARRSAAEADAAIAALAVSKSAPREVLTVNKVRDIVNASEKTYFFPGMESTLDDVTLTVKSVTPWAGNSVLTLELNNGQTKYFFVSGIAVTSGGTPLPVQSFNDPFVPAGRKATFFLIVRALNAEAVAVKLSESGGEGRVFDLKVSVP